VQLADGADAIAVFVDCDVSRPVLEKLKTAKCIVTESTGMDHIDAEAAKDFGIQVKNVPGYGTYAVAEFTFALMLMVTRRMYHAAAEVKMQGVFDVQAARGSDLHGKTLGVIGTGKIGRQVVEISKGFGMKVIAYDAMPDQDFARSLGFTYTDIPTVLSQSDIITLHIPYLPHTKHMINAEAFSKMKEGVFLINTARGELVDTEALVEALRVGRVAGAGLDVLEDERALKNPSGNLRDERIARTLLSDHIVMQMPNVIVTPHIAFHSKEADEDRVSRAVQEILSSAQPHSAS
jgi:D-lactate dehydrogenase